MSLRILLAHPGPSPAPPLSSLLPRLGSIDLGLVALESRNDDEALTSALLAALGEDEPAKTILAGFSLGARIAAQACTQVPVLGLIGLAFPFHKRGLPKERHGLAALSQVSCPALIIQGTRDAHGNQQAVGGMGLLPESVELLWLEDGNHQWRSRAGRSPNAADHLDTAATAILQFAKGLVSTAHV